MNTYVIERDIANVGRISEEDLVSLSKKSCDVLKEMGPDRIIWIKSYIVEDKIYCIYQAISEDIIKEHAKKGCFPVNKITEVISTIGPYTSSK